jgi:hypothetical protein
MKMRRRLVLSPRHFSSTMTKLRDKADSENTAEGVLSDGDKKLPRTRISLKHWSLFLELSQTEQLKMTTKLE